MQGQRTYCSNLSAIVSKSDDHVNSSIHNLQRETERVLVCSESAGGARKWRIGLVG